MSSRTTGVSKPQTSKTQTSDLRPRKHRPRKLRPLENTDLENTDPLKIEMYYGHAITTQTIYLFINFERIRFRFTAVATGKKIARSGVDAKVKS